MSEARRYDGVAVDRAHARRPGRRAPRPGSRSHRRGARPAGARRSRAAAPGAVVPVQRRPRAGRGRCRPRSWPRTGRRARPPGCGWPPGSVPTTTGSFAFSLSWQASRLAATAPSGEVPQTIGSEPASETPSSLPRLSTSGETGPHSTEVSSRTSAARSSAARGTSARPSACATSSSGVASSHSEARGMSAPASTGMNADPGVLRTQVVQRASRPSPRPRDGHRAWRPRRRR